VNDTWKRLKDTVTLAEVVALGKVDRAECNRRFDAECERLTAVKVMRVKKCRKETTL
jgi:hypothetical protein